MTGSITRSSKPSEFQFPAVWWCFFLHKGRVWFHPESLVSGVGLAGNRSQCSQWESFEATTGRVATTTLLSEPYKAPCHTSQAKALTEKKFSKNEVIIQQGATGTPAPRHASWKRRVFGAKQSQSLVSPGGFLVAHLTSTCPGLLDGGHVSAGLGQIQRPT